MEYEEEYYEYDTDYHSQDGTTEAKEAGEAGEEYLYEDEEEYYYYDEDEEPTVKEEPAKPQVSS